MRNTFKSLLITCGALAFIGAAAAEDIHGLKKPTSIGVKDGKRYTFKADDVSFWPVQGATKKGRDADL